MKNILVFILFFTALNFTAQAQDDLFGKTSKLPPRKGFILGVNGDFDNPAGDMAKRFGLSYRVGAEVLYKLKSNWVWGAKVDFILGDKIKEDSLMINLKDNYGMVNGQDGNKVYLTNRELGYMIGLQVGKIINISKTSSDNGIMFLTSVGFLQHKINIYNRDQNVASIKGDYRKGYDRLTNGLFLEEYVSYNYFANNGLINFNIGLDFMAGFTKGRRDFLYDVMRTDDKQRIDILFGIRGGWYIPMFKRKSEEFFFE